MSKNANSLWDKELWKGKHNWSVYVSGSVQRQQFLATALSWVAASKGQEKEGYMAEHRLDTHIKELKTYFNSVIDWTTKRESRESLLSHDRARRNKKGFNNPRLCRGRRRRRGLEWGRLYEEYHKKSYDPAKVSKTVQKLYADVYVKNRRGVFEYILGGEKDTKLLEIRVFDDATKQTVYKQQTAAAKKKGESNCPLCAIGHGANKTKIWEQKEMDADHVTAWSKGGATDIKNCQMLCRTHNQAKGNK